MRVEIMDIPFDNVTMDEAVDAAVRILERPENAYCVTPNSEIVYDSFTDQQLREVLCQADLVLPDGAGVVLASRILGTPVKQKVAGIEFIEALMLRLEHTEYSFFLLGGKPGVADAARENLLKRYPGLTICGTADGYFQEDAAAIAAVNQAHPDVLLVCLGAPKQEFFMKNHLHELDARFMVGLGGSLDNFAGNVRRAPAWMIRCNLEWFYRLCREPWRLGRMMRLPKFLFKVILRRLKGS